MVIFLIAALFSPLAEARVFDLKSATIGTYFGGTIGSSQLSKQPWGDSSGTTTVTDSSVRLNYSGEFGVLMAIPKINLRFGVEYLQPQRISDIRGRNSSDQLLFTLNSNTRAIIPKATVEFVVSQTNSSAIIFGGSAGYAMVTMENQYEIGPQGPTDYPSVTNFSEKAKGNAIGAEGFIGYEFVFSDNVTLFTNVGYRYLLVTELKHQNSHTGYNGPVAKDSTVTNQDGKNRTLNMSAAQAAFHFRFYF